MANAPTFAGKQAFLRGGGAVADLIAAFDWSSTSLGPLEKWPAALKTATSMILNASLPMSLLVGEDAIALFNDAQGELYGEDLARALGAKAREHWPEYAPLTEAAIEAGKRGERLFFRELELPNTYTGGSAWLNIDYSPVRDENGAYIGVLSVMVDMTNRVQAERRAILQLDRLRNMFDQAPGFISLMGGPPDYVVEYVNDAHRQLFGDRKAEGRRYVDVFPEAVASGRAETLFQVGESGESPLKRGAPILIPTSDGGMEEHFIDVVIQPLRHEDGPTTGLFVQGFDVTALVRAQKEAEATARRLGSAVKFARLGTFELVQETLEAKLDDRAREIFGFGPDEHLTAEDLMSRVDPDDLTRLVKEGSAALAAGQTRLEASHCIRLPDGATRYVRVVGDLAAGPDGGPFFSVGMLEDVTDRRRAEQRQQLLINELNHRVKNTLATVQSVASQTLRSAPDLPQARGAFEDRLVALAAAHDLLTAQSWRGAPLAEVVASALAPFEAVQRPQVTRAGPSVWLTASRALALSLALHELATNATKYGALAVPEGRVNLSWTLCAGELVLVWTERGGPAVATPSRSGFGIRLLQRNLARELGGHVALDFAPEGVRCEIRFAIEGRGPATGANADESPFGPPGRFWVPHPYAGFERSLLG